MADYDKHYANRMKRERAAERKAKNHPVLCEGCGCVKNSTNKTRLCNACTSKRRANWIPKNGK